jgi:hypothetical protein
MTTPSTSTRLKKYVARVSGPRLRRTLMSVYRRSRVLRDVRRHVLRRARGGWRRAVQRAGHILLTWTGRGQRTGVFIVVSTIGTGEQAPSPTLMQSINTAAAAGAPVEVLLADYDADLDAQFAAYVEHDELQAGVTVRRFWRDATPGAGLSRPRHTTAGLVAGPAPGAEVGEWRAAFYRSGTPALAVDEKPTGSIVEHYGTLGQPVRRDEIDAEGRLVRIVDIHPDTGRDVTHRYPMGDDTCWLSVWVNATDGSLGPAHQHLPAPREFASLRAVQARWIDQVAARTARPVLIAADAQSQELVRMVEHTGAIRGVLAGEVTTAQWQALVSGSGNGSEALRTMF